MNVFRTCRIATYAPALKFVKRTQNISSLIRLLSTSEMIDEVFHRPLPISKTHESRFAPEGFSKNVLYSSDQKETTLFEYGYHLLKNSSLLNIGVYANIYSLNLLKRFSFLDVSQLPYASDILSKSSYLKAHTWIQAQDLNSLNVIQYPNVHNPDPGGLNFAIFDQSLIQRSAMLPETLVLTPKEDHKILVQSQNKALKVISPLMF